MLPPELANPFRRPPAVPLNPDTAGFVEDMLGKEARKAFEALDKEPKEKPQELIEEEKAAMRKAEKRLLERSREVQFKTWKTIKLGKHKSAAEMDKAFKAGGFDIGDHVINFFKKVTFSGSPLEIELVDMSFEDLGFEGSASAQEIFDHAAKFGLVPCPAEGAPELRLQYPDQPKDDSFILATEPIEDVVAFRVANIGRGVWLAPLGNGLGGTLGGALSAKKWKGEEHWVFMRSKSAMAEKNV